MSMIYFWWIGCYPGLSGIEIVREIRKNNPTIPVIFLTARDTVDDTMFGLESGANDYIKKPFQFAELLARIKVQLRTKTTDIRISCFGPDKIITGYTSGI